MGRNGREILTLQDKLRKTNVVNMLLKKLHNTYFAKKCTKYVFLLYIWDIESCPRYNEAIVNGSRKVKMFFACFGVHYQLI